MGAGRLPLTIEESIVLVDLFADVEVTGGLTSGMGEIQGMIYSGRILVGHTP